METWKLLLITLLSAVVLGCVIGVVTGKHQVKKARGGYHPLLTLKEKIVYSLLVIFGAGCIAIGVFVVPGMSAAEDSMMLDGMVTGEIIYDEFGNPMPGAMVGDGFVEGMPGDVMVNNAAPDVAADEAAAVDEAEAEIAEAEVAGEEATEAETAEGETTEGETTEDESAVGETAEDETAETDATEAEVVADDADDTAVATPAPRPRRVIRGSGGAVAAYRAG